MYNITLYLAIKRKELKVKKAFTMIELIFVIVIIGILSAIAIPKLAATRDDAEVSARAHAVAEGANEIAAYALSRGVPSSNLPSMSSIVRGLIAQGNAVFANNVLSVKMHTVNDCLKLKVSSSSTDMNLTLSYGIAGSDSLCLALQNTIDANKYPMPLRGTKIVR